MRRWLPGTAASLVLIAAVVLLAVPGAGAEPKKKPPEAEAVSPELYRDLDLFAKVLHYVQNDYVETPEDRGLIYGAIRGMLATLDPHSVFLSPEVYKELKVDTEGRFGGVGLEVAVKDSQLTVVTPMEGSPAARAGVREGDRILKIDGQATKDMDLSEAVRKMRGKPGATVHLTIRREGRKDPLEFSLTRETIRLESVRAEELEPGYGYAKLSSFQEKTGRDLRRALERLNAKRPLQGLILDLRNNPGGLLDQAVEVTDLFLESGVIVATRSRHEVIDERVAGGKGPYPELPLIVLVNGGSASAAEIVAGALQDHKRAVLLGTQTFGKGSVQTVFDLGDGSALKLTVARYYTPKGRSIQEEGIAPDIVVPSEAPPAGAKPAKTVREKDLKGHLKKEGAAPPADDAAAPSPSGDYQKEIALDYLKSWYIFGPREKLDLPPKEN